MYPDKQRSNTEQIWADYILKLFDRELIRFSAEENGDSPPKFS